MGDLKDRLDAAKTEVVRLERQAAFATCVELGHRWKFIGCSLCCCEDGYCSVPVHECEACRDCDYGDNPEATKIRARCAERVDNG